MPQPLWYHDFADARKMLGVPNALNVLSNLPFMVVGLFGLVFCLRGKPAAFLQDEHSAYTTLFLGLFLTGIGSSYYHLAPDNQRLLWDRLPMTVAMAGFIALLLVNRIERRIAWVLPLLVALGTGSALQWSWSERQGNGDLRWYLLYQTLVMVSGVLLLLMFRGRNEPTKALVWAVLGNVTAKLFELLDKPIYNCGHLISGHTLKHLSASLGFIPLLFWFAAQRRQREAHHS